MAKKSHRIGKIPAFIKKLKEILDDISLTAVIVWLTEGNGFQILNISSFTDTVLPKYFKHRNMSSFVRQLNMYGFTRPKDSDQNTYIHPRFQKGNLNNMKFIKRKRTNTKNKDQSDENQESVEVERIQGNQQESMLDDLNKLKEENNDLRAKNIQLSTKLKEFQQIMSKLKHYANQMQKVIYPIQNQLQNQKVEKQASSSADNSTSSQSSSRRGFSICNSSIIPKTNYQSSYRLLLEGGKSQKQESS